MRNTQGRGRDDTCEFAAVARGFASWCEASTLGPDPDIAAVEWLAKLHTAALRLPLHEPQNDGALAEIPADLLMRVNENLQRYMGWYYREFFDPSPSLNDEHVLGDVGDDLLDIYRDVRAGLIAYDAGDEHEALWYWSFMHRSHWGRHAVGAQFALHCLPRAS